MVDRIETPRDFYTNVVAVDRMEFLAKPKDLRLAYHACGSLLSLRDWVFETYKGVPWTWAGTQQSAFASKKALQSSLERLHDEFRIITDVANASKHLVLDKDRRRTKAEGIANVQIQSTTTYIGGAVIGRFGFNTTMLNEPPKVITADVVIIDDNGKLYDVRISVESTYRIWAQLLDENKW